MCLCCERTAYVVRAGADAESKVGPMMLSFYPVAERWAERLAEARALSGAAAVEALRALARTRLDFLQVTKLDRALTRAMEDEGARTSLPTVRLAVLGTSTVGHLPGAMRVAGLARGLLVEVYEGGYGIVQGELMDPASELHAFRPEVVLLAFDARYVAGTTDATAEHAMAMMRECWAAAREHFGCAVVQQTVLPVFPLVMGNNEQQMPGSAASVVERVNAELRASDGADAAGVHLLGLDVFFRGDGLAAWYEPALWHRSKHEVHPRAALVYGDQVARVLAAMRGLSSKCLVLDLDNTLWGGVIGDDGLEGIVLGQGHAVGEAYAGFQRYCASLASRGVVLAVCSKNDEANARLPFREHPEMVLRERDIAAFAANWDDKATNVRELARRLKLGLDALVFVDDNPAERALIRRELPEVQVPEMPEDPALFADTLASAGYFEATRVTEDDRARCGRYRADAERTRAMGEVTDLESYLRSLEMVLTARAFDEVGVGRITQLINKTNQFNLTTRRMSDAEVRAVMVDPDAMTMQVRLRDRFGDNGMIAVLIARADGADAVVETWLMSCRVLGRRVEEACLHLLARVARERGLQRLVGVYRPTAKNGMVRELYARLGFAATGLSDGSGEERFVLQLDGFSPRDVPMEVVGEFAGAETVTFVRR